MPAFLVAGATVTQNLSFSSLVVAIAIASTHCTYPRRDGQAELTWVAGYILTYIDFPVFVGFSSCLSCGRLN